MATNLTLASFTLLMYLVWTFYGFIDSLGQGMTAMITKMELRLQALDKESVKKFEEGDDKKAFGNYYIFRFLVRSGTNYIGGLVASRLNIKYLFIVLIVASVLMIFVTLFIFREERVKNNSKKLNSSNFFRNFQTKKMNYCNLSSLS